MTRERVDLRPESERVLRALGKEQAGDVYREASSLFRERVLEEEFLGRVELMNKSLGEFIRTLDVLDSELLESYESDVARVVLRLQFEKANTSGTFSFQRKGKQWRLLGFRVPVPEGLRKEHAALEHATARSEAPEEVVQLTKSIVSYLSEKKLAEVYDGAAPALRKSVSRSEFGTMITGWSTAWGPLLRFLSVMESVQNAEGNRVEVEALLEFERDTALLRFHFVRGKGGWQLAGLRTP